VADRTVTVRLNAAVSGYIAQMQAAGRATAQVGTQGANVAKDVGMISPKLLGVASAAAVVGGMAVMKMANFEAALSEVKAATGETAAGMDSLRDAAMAAGGATKFSAEEAAQGITNLAKAGVSTKDILDGGLDGALALAAAGSMEVADAAEIASAALVTFKLEGEDMTHVADLLAAGAGKAMGEVSDLGYALKMAGTVAAQTGLGIEETTAALASMASRGITGSDAGTSLKSFLQRLVPDSKKAREAMMDIGLAAYDAEGKFIGLEAVAGQLRDGLKDLTQEEQAAALKTIFGSDAVRAAAVLYEEGADGVAQWTKNVDDAGYAAEYAATLTDNLKGDVEKLTGALDTLFITSADGANGPLRDAVQGMTAMLEAVTDLDAALKDTGDAKPWGGGLFEGTLGAGRRFVDFVKAGPGGLTNTTTGPEVDASALGSSRAADAYDVTSRRAALADGAVTGLADAIAEQEAAAASAAAEMEALNKAYLESIEMALGASDAAIGYEASLDDLTKTIKDNGKNTDIGTEKGRENVSAVNDLVRASADLIAQMIEQGDEQGAVAKKADEMADAVYDAARQAGFGKEEAEKLADALRDVPEEVKPEVTVKGAKKAEDEAKRVQDALDGIDRKVTISIAVRQGVTNKLKNMPTFHEGGQVYGSGDVPATLQGGEYVINRNAYAANADLVRAINSGQKVTGAGAPLVGQINVTAAKPERAGQDVIDSLAEAAYRMGGVR
jgi:TP901 family phage tail tape measure protein